MGLSITIASGKGSVGKSTLAANLGAALAELGKDVTILDADDLGLILDLKVNLKGTKTTLHDVLTGKVDVTDAIYEGSVGVKVVPSGDLDSLSKADLKKLENVLDEVLKTTEVLLIDTPAGLERSAIPLLTAGQELLLVVNPGSSLISDALVVETAARKLGAHIFGAVVNRAGYDRADLSVQEIETILETKVIAVIPEDPEIRKTSISGQPVVLTNPNSPAAIAIKKLAADITGVKLKPSDELEKLSKRLISIKGMIESSQPISTEKVNTELEGIMSKVNTLRTTPTKPSLNLPEEGLKPSKVQEGRSKEDAREPGWKRPLKTIQEKILGPKEERTSTDELVRKFLSILPSEAEAEEFLREKGYLLLKEDEDLIQKWKDTSTRVRKTEKELQRLIEELYIVENLVREKIERSVQHESEILKKWKIEPRIGKAKMSLMAEIFEILLEREGSAYGIAESLGMDPHYVLATLKELEESKILIEEGRKVS